MNKKKIIVTVALFMAFCAYANQPVTTTEREKCTTVSGSTNGVVVGASTQTCVTTHNDGSRTVKQKTCATGGFSGSVGVAKGSVTTSDCTTTTTYYPSSTSTTSNGVTRTRTIKQKNTGTYLGGNR